MLSVRDLIKDIKNIQTKQKYLNILKNFDAAQSSFGFIYRDGTFVLYHIY